MNKKELAIKLSKEKGIKIYQALEIVEYVFDTIQKTVTSGTSVTIVGFGKFERKLWKRRTVGHIGKYNIAKTKDNKMVKFTQGSKTKRMARKSID